MHHCTPWAPDPPQRSDHHNWRGNFIVALRFIGRS
nr:MAG TPA: hypothetical protein [Caudoviricetes sp.]